MIVLGAGLVGLASAWWLQRHGHRVLLVDPGVGADEASDESGNEPQTPSPDNTNLTGSQAALGVVMARVFHRSRGRSWSLRQHSLRLWAQWRQILADRGETLPWRPGLLLLASDTVELERHRALVADPARQGMGLEFWGQDRLEALSPSAPKALGGLFSAADGQLDPGRTLRALQRDGITTGLCCRSGRAAALEARDKGWQVHLEGGEVEDAEWILVCAGMASSSILDSLGVNQAMEPVLGQALELELATHDSDPQTVGADWNWPGAVVLGGINLIPRPDLEGGRRFWMGATLETGLDADPARLDSMRTLSGAAPAWLVSARERRRWQGLRCRPVGQPAPLLEEVAPGVLLLSGHYRNGMLLAPASADWALQRMAAAGRIF